MITKIGDMELRKRGDPALAAVDYAGSLFLGPESFVGAYRAGRLSPEEEYALKQHYGLDDGANLRIRNALRGKVGGVGGAAAGLTGLGLLGAALGSHAVPNDVHTGRLAGIAAGGLLGALGGYLTGTKLMTDKYSIGNANRIMSSEEAR